MAEYDFIKNYDITHLTTFGIKAKTALFAEYTDWKELTRICRTDEYLCNQVFHIGGGSNLLFINDYNGLILHSGIKGIVAYPKKDEENTVFVIAGAGERWDDLVSYCVENDFAGLENLSGIPGEVGAAPVQNVGAYGVEAGDLIHNVEVFDRLTNKVETIKGTDCAFAYRNSNFKTIWRDRYFVLRVSFRLHKSSMASCLTYGSLSDLEHRLGHTPTLKDVRKEVLAIRDRKLPAPALIGSAGSFFKNPIVRRAYYEKEMLNYYPDIPSYPVEIEQTGSHYTGDNQYVKIPAGWLIEHAGLKGASVGGAIVYPDNCLVIANTGNATAGDVMMLADKVRRQVNRAFHIWLQPEVNYIDTDIRVTILGSGTSKGVPEVGCDCDTCVSNDPHDKRLRCSALVETMGMKILIDPSPDFREQALRLGLHDIDAVIITHEHYDHVGGIDDLRPFCAQSKINLYMSKKVADALRKRLDYCFKDVLYPGVPQLNIVEIDNRPFYINGLEIIPVEVHHGKLPIFGYRIGKFSYITDIKTIEEEEKGKLEDLDVLVVSALRDRQHFAHFTIREALDLIEELKPKRAFLTHLCHEAGRHDALDCRLPDYVHPAYDGMKITVK